MPRLLPLRAGLINPLCRAVAGGTFPRAAWRVNKQEGSTKHEKEQGRKAKMGRVREKAEGVVGKEGGFLSPFFWCVWHPRVGQRDAVMLLPGKGLWTSPPRQAMQP